MLRNKHIIIFILYVLIISLIYIQVVLFGKTLMPNLYYTGNLSPCGYEGRRPVNVFNIDLGTPSFYEMPINKLVGDMHLKAQMPLWNPYNGVGSPLAAQYSTRAFFPYQVLEDILPERSWDYFMLGRLIIAAFFTYLFLTLLGLSSPAAFLGGIFYSLSGSFIWFVNLEQFVNVAMMVPICLFSIERLFLFRSKRYIAEAAIVFALMYLAGQPEIAIYVLLLAAAYYIFRVVTAGPKFSLGSLSSGPKAALRFIGISILGLGLCAFLILPFLELIHNSYHCHPLGGPMGIQAPARLNMAVNIIIPSFSELPTYYRIFPHNGSWDWLGGYTGALVLILIISAFFYEGGYRKVFLFFASLGFLIVLKNFGFPLVAWIGRLPLLDQSWSPRWSGPVWTFSLACAAAVGYEIITQATHKKRLIHWLAALFLFIIAAFLSYKTGYFFNIGNFDAATLQAVLPAVLGGITVGICVILISIYLILKCKNRKGLICSIISLSIFELWFYIPRGAGFPWNALRLAPFLLSIPVVFLLAKERWRLAIAGAVIVVLSYTFIDLSSPHGFPQRYNVFQEPNYIEFLKKDRFARVVAGEGLLMPNFSSAFRVFDIRYINSLAPVQYQYYVENHLLKAPHMEPTDRLWFTGLPDSYKKVQRSLYEEIKDNILYYSFLGTKYIITTKDVSFNLPLVYDEEVRIYENPYSFPRVYIAHNTEKTSNYQDAQKMMSERGFDIKETVALEEEAPGWYKYSSAIAGRKESIEIKEYTPNMINISADIESDGIAVLTDLYYPGWKVFVDGKEDKIFRINGLVRGVFLKAGRHTLIYKYSPLSFRIGLTISVVCLILCIFLIFKKGKER